VPVATRALSGLHESRRAYLSIPGNERPQLPRGLGGEMGGWGLRGRCNLTQLYISAAINWLRDDMSLLPTIYLSQSYRAGLEWNLLNVGTGLLVGLNVGMSCCSEHSSLPTAWVHGSSNPALARKS
jgi:hypothetical protein